MTGGNPMRRACFWTILGVVSVAAIWRGVAGRLQAADLARASRSVTADRASMKTA